MENCFNIMKGEGEEKNMKKQFCNPFTLIELLVVI